MLSNMRLCANVPGQYAIQTALGGYQSINELIAAGGRLRRQRDLAYELITAIPGVSCVKPKAALYMFPRLDPKIYPIADDRQFFLELLQETRVMLVQGSGFNYPDNQTTSASCSCPTRTTCARPSAASRASSTTIASDIAHEPPRSAFPVSAPQGALPSRSGSSGGTMKPIQVGLLGIGTVGSGVFKVLQRNQEEIQRRAGRGIEITMVADLDTARARGVVGSSCPGGRRRPRR